MTDRVYIFAADDMEADVIAGRAMCKLSPVPSCWLVVPLDPPPPPARRLFDWWAPRMRLYQVHVEPKGLLDRLA